MLKQWARAHWTQSSVGVQRTDIDTGTDTRAGEGKAPTQTIGNKEQLIQKLLPVKHLAKRSLCLWSLLFNISEHMDLQQNQKITEHQSDWKQFWWLPRKVAGCQWESVFIVDKKVFETTAGESRQIRGPETTKTVRPRKKCKTYLWNPIKYYRTQTNFSCVSFCIQAKKWFQLKFFINQCFLSYYPFICVQFHGYIQCQKEYCRHVPTLLVFDKIPGHTCVNADTDFPPLSCASVITISVK